MEARVKLAPFAKLPSEAKQLLRMVTERNADGSVKEVRCQIEGEKEGRIELSEELRKKELPFIT
jgi:hypothetical protein